MDCLIEVASLNPADLVPYRGAIQLLLVHFLRSLSQVIPLNTDLRRAYEAGTEEEQLFVSRLALFLSTFLRNFLPFFEQPDGSLSHEQVVVEALLYMVWVSEVDDEEVFKTCLDFWAPFSKDLYNADISAKSMTAMPPAGGPGHIMGPAMTPHGIPTTGHNGALPALQTHPGVYEAVLHSLRIIMIDKMAKPEEVIVVENEDGEIVREMTKDTEVSLCTCIALWCIIDL